jgi:esterase/lipase superfamily enzyme
MSDADWFIDLRAWSHGGPIGTLKVTDGKGTILDPAQLVRAVAGRDVLLMTHGFENNRPDGTAKLNEWKAHLNLDPMPLYIGVLWPGDCIIPMALDYIWEGGEAQKSGTLLGHFVDTHFGDVASLSFGSHSLGVRVMLQAIRQLADGKTVRHLYLMAPAIEDDTLNKEFQDAAQKIKHVSVLFSMKDHVLALAYPAGNLVGGLLERGDPNLKAALGRSGPSPQVPGNVVRNGRLPDGWDYGHSDYLTTNTVLGNFPGTITIPTSDTPEFQLDAPIVPPTPLTLTNTKAWKPCWSADFFTTRWPLS